MSACRWSDDTLGVTRKIDWGSEGEFRPYERFVSRNVHFFLLAPICTSQCLEDLKALRGLLLQHPSVHVEGEVRVELHSQ